MEKRNKIALIGAGQIGSTIAHLSILKNLGDIVLLDKKKELAIAKAMDLENAMTIEGQDNSCIGTDDYEDIRGANAIIVTAGSPRMPWMKDRADLMDINSKVITQVGEQIKKYAPDAFIVVVTNPLDDMAYLMQKTTGFSTNKVLGMAGVLDSARFAGYIAKELGISRRDVTATVLGLHNNNMKPLSKFSSVRGMPLDRLIADSTISKEKIEEIIEKTKKAGKEISNLMGESGSAYYGPATAAVTMIDAYLNNKKRILICSTYIEAKNSYIGMPVIIGNKGVEQTVSLF